ncbi:baculoviral IAP repeat-containing protein 2-like isoform X2 [Gigantopelta aegis]|uniref:baculoviral IAP repeat-containing protein 2-like isoform X2 n=1 Tax=Gigantopelta aegis TaxID=1735272 RepID=UPI001B88A085|nr:baculoviral IAP repeat-containing protein 2-like isoform X2 [Gigantopelta aegis]
MENYGYPEMREEVKRLLSFQQYAILSSADEESMSRFISPMKLSNAGFFRQAGSPVDEVTCFACSVTFSGWNGQSPLAVHRVLNPECLFLNEVSENRQSTQSASLATSTNAVRRRLFETPERGTEQNNAGTSNSSGTPSEQQDLLPRFAPVCGGNEMLFETHRLLTFVDPSNRQSEEWAANGFIYQSENNAVKCVFCGKESNFETEQPPFEVHRSISANCPIVKYIDVGNITRDLETSVKSQQLNIDLNGHSQRLLGYLHPQFEDEDDRKKTFEYWPCLPQTEEQLVEAGFYFTGISDKVVCFACGFGLRKWRPSAEPWVEHARHSPDCQFVKEKKGEEFIRQAAAVTEVLTKCDPPQEGPVSTNGPVHTVNPGKPHLDMSAVSAAMECGQYPNSSILLGLLQATDTNFTMLQRKDGELQRKDGELQRKDGELQRKDGELQRKDGELQLNYRELQRKNEELQREREELQRKERELEMIQLEARAAECQLVREQQTHRALVEGQAAVIQRHVQEIRNREQNYHQLQQQHQQQQQQLQQQSQNYQQQLYLANQQLYNQTQQLENKQQIEENQTEMIRRLAGELQKVGRDPREIPDDDSEEDTTPPGVIRCKVCLSEEVNVLFRPCRHICCGSQCAPQFIGQHCPVCRGAVQEWELIFIS